MAHRRSLLDLANAIALRLFHPCEPGPFADRLVLVTNDGRDHGGWGLPNARNAILDELRKRARKTLRRKRKRT